MEVCIIMNMRKMTKISILSAIATLLMFFEIPLWFAPNFYKIDFSEAAVLIGAFALGPVSGIAIEFIKIILISIIKGSHTFFVGETANFIIGCTFVLPAAILYKRYKSKRTALVGMGIGTVFMAAVGSAINAFVLLPLYAKAFEMPMDQIVAMGNVVNKNINSLSTLVFYAVVPFNIIKGIAVSTITFILYKHIRKVLL